MDAPGVEARALLVSDRGVGGRAVIEGRCSQISEAEVAICVVSGGDCCRRPDRAARWKAPCSEISSLLLLVLTT